MGNINNCLTNSIEYEEIKIRNGNNIIKNQLRNKLRNSNSKDVSLRYYLFNKKNLEIIDEEENPETNFIFENQPKDRCLHSMAKLINENITSTPKDIKVIENNYNNIKINNNQNIMYLDNNVLFNSTRKSNSKQNTIENYKNNNIKEDNRNGYNYNGILKKNIFNENINSSDNNFEVNKLINSEEESDNLIILEYNNPDTKKINVNNIDGNDNNECFNPKSCEKNLNNFNNDFKNNSINENNNNIINGINMKNDNINKMDQQSLNDKKVNNINNNITNLNSNLISYDKSSNINNSNINEVNPEEKIIKTNKNINIKINNNSNSEKIIKNDNIESSNNFKSNIPYVKPRLTLNFTENLGVLNDNKNFINLNKKNIINNQMNKESINNINNYNLKIKTLSKNNSFKLTKNKSLDKIEPNLNKDINNKYKKTLNLEKDSLQNLQNIKYKNNNPIRLFSNSSNNISSQNKIQPQKQNLKNYKESNQYNNTIFNIDNNKIYDSPIIRHNRVNPELNEEIYKNKDNNENQSLINSKSQELLQSKDEIINNNSQNMSPEEKILYQSAICDNIPEEGLKNKGVILKKSASFDNLEFKKNNQEKNYENNFQNEQNFQKEIGSKNDYSQINEQYEIKSPLKNLQNYDYESIIVQQKEQIKKNPEYEQTQQALEENKKIIEFQQEVLTEQEIPKDKDSEFEIEQKIIEKESFNKEEKNYNQNNLLPMTIDRVTFKKDENFNSSNDRNKNINYIQKINKSKISENHLDKYNFNRKEYELSNFSKNQFFSMPLIPSLNTNEESKCKIYNKYYKTNRSNITNEENNGISKNDDVKSNIIYNKLNCKEFEDFSPNSWERFYPKNEIFFKFKELNIIHGQLIAKDIGTINEEIYEGDINNNGEKHGFGKYISPLFKRIGMWKRDNFTGWGREINKNGEIYEGKFVNGKLNGRGTYKNMNNKETYIGEFMNSMKHGKGELYNNEFHYTGDFIYNKMNGKGKIEIYNEGEYEGTFKDDQFDGKGMLKWKNGNYYIGELSNGKINGYGEEIFLDGTIYKGYFVNNIKQGKGKMITPKGKVYEGLFINGEFVDGDVYKYNN